MTSYVRRLVRSQSALHSQVKRMDTVCSSQQAEIRRQQALLQAQAVTIAELQGEQVDQPQVPSTSVIPDQGESCKQDVLKKRNRDDEDQDPD